MKKLLILFVAVAGFLVACSQTEPAADTSGLMHKDQAPAESGDASGGAPQPPPTDAAEGSSEGG
ncbi:MAG: hypothetical protein KF824_10845 [Fimbriimonadaceae bacterium]|nr:MAG: hypothetical protein KF824_10845 [Fimbriimonadaceae bacterium]